MLKITHNTYTNITQYTNSNTYTRATFNMFDYMASLLNSRKHFLLLFVQKGILALDDKTCRRYSTQFLLQPPFRCYNPLKISCSPLYLFNDSNGSCYLKLFITIWWFQFQGISISKVFIRDNIIEYMHPNEISKSRYKPLLLYLIKCYDII